MKKKSLSVKRKIHRFLLDNLKTSKVKKIYNIFKKNIHNLPEKNSFAVAVSGGPDSLALSYLAKCYSLEKKNKIFFYHVDHRLRSNSKNESLLLKKKMMNFDINVKILTWKGKKPKSNIQSLARLNRYSLLDKQCKKDKLSNLLLAHQKEDLYENFFLRILRGSGLEGFVSFNSVKSNSILNLNLLRPLINISKGELIYISKKIFNFYIKDPSNNDDLFKRIRVRNLISNFKKEGLDLDKLKLTINNLTESNKTINYFVEKNIKNNTKFIRKNSALILNKNFFKQPDEIIFRSISKLLKKVGQKYYPPRGKSTLHLMRQMSEKNFKKTTLSGCMIEKYNNSVIICKESTKKHNFATK